jgi:ADP-ribosylglycohydrolase
MSTNDRAINAVRGTFVADAAALGFHWLYKPERIRELEPQTPEFHAPNPEDYTGKVGVFVHGKRARGQQSQYGEQCLTMLRALSKRGGDYDKEVYERTFRAHFGYGGEFVGYIDHPTRWLLDRIACKEADVKERIMQIEVLDPRGITAERKRRWLQTVFRIYKSEPIDERPLRIEEAIVEAEGEAADVEFGLSAYIQVREQLETFHGVEDDQLPALSKLSPLLLRAAQDEAFSCIAESAIRVTHQHERALSYGLAATKLLSAAMETGSKTETFAQVAQLDNAEVRDTWQEALQSEEADCDAFAGKVGRHCDLRCGTAVALHILANTDSFTEAIRQNIWIGGDSCGRAMLLGPLAGAIYGSKPEAGIPEAWWDLLERKPEVEALCAQVTG